MKKLIILIFIMVSSLGLYSDDFIKITYPEKDIVWVRGNTYTIRWKHNMGSAQHAKLVLLNNRGRIISETPEIAASEYGIHRWTIPSTLVPGKYRIRIKILRKNIFDDSDIFKISSGEISGKIHLPKKQDISPAKPNITPILKIHENNLLIPKPTILYFKADKRTIHQGESVVLSYHYVNAYKATIYERINGGNMDLPATGAEAFRGSWTVKPEKNSRYELNVASRTESTYKSITITVLKKD